MRAGTTRVTPVFALTDAEIHGRGIPSAADLGAARGQITRSRRSTSSSAGL